jgi:hypothetical protein
LDAAAEDLRHQRAEGRLAIRKQPADVEASLAGGGAGGDAGPTGAVPLTEPADAECALSIAVCLDHAYLEQYLLAPGHLQGIDNGCRTVLLGDLEDLALGDAVGDGTAQAHTSIDGFDLDSRLGNRVPEGLREVRHVGADLDVGHAQERIIRTVNRYVGAPRLLPQDVEGLVRERNGRCDLWIADNHAADGSRCSRVDELALRHPDFRRHSGLESDQAVLGSGRRRESAAQRDGDAEDESGP